MKCITRSMSVAVMTVGAALAFPVTCIAQGANAANDVQLQRALPPNQVPLPPARVVPPPKPAVETVIAPGVSKKFHERPYVTPTLKTRVLQTGKSGLEGLGTAEAQRGVGVQQGQPSQPGQQGLQRQ